LGNSFADDWRGRDRQLEISGDNHRVDESSMAEDAASGPRPTQWTGLKKPAAGFPARAFEFLR